VVLTTDELLKTCTKDLKKLETKTLSSDGEVAVVKLSELVEDVQDARRPLDRSLRTRKAADGAALTAAALISIN
jgi:hypothetical protein